MVGDDQEEWIYGDIVLITGYLVTDTALGTSSVDVF